MIAGVALGKGSIDCEACFRMLSDDSPLERINIEVCYDYRAPFRRERSPSSDGRLGEGAFTLAESPYEPSYIAPPQGRRTKAEDLNMIGWQDQAVLDSVRDMKNVRARLLPESD